MPTTAETITYRLIDGQHDHPTRSVIPPLDREQLAQLDRDGYLALPGAIADDRRARLLAAIDRLAQRVDAGELPPHQPGAQFYRDLMLHDEAFVELMLDPLNVGAARTMLGPQVRLRGMTCRDNRAATGGNPGFGWHIHQRGASEPQPPWWSPLHGLDCLHYLDGLDASTGAVAVVPGSHRQPQLALALDQADHPGQQVLELPAGSLLLMHPNTYHRSLPAASSAARRRLVIVSFVPSWYRWSPHDVCDRSAWIADMAERWCDQPERLELIGIGGYN